jgi:hypothetical protein
MDIKKEGGKMSRRIKRELCWTVIAICLIAIILEVFAWAQEVPLVPTPNELQWEDTPWGQFALGTITKNMLIARTNVPMIADRLKTYGDIQATRDGRGRVVSREVNIEHKGLVTAKGNAVYDALIALRTGGGIFMIANVTLNHAVVTVVWYERFTQEKMVPRVLSAFGDVLGEEAE